MPTSELNYQQTKRKRKYIKGKGLNKKQVATVKAIVEKEIKPIVELKHHDQPENRVEITNFNFGGGNNMYNLTSIAQGLQDTQRVGDRIDLKSIFIRALFQFNLNPQDRTPIIRLTLFQWKQDNQVVTPTAADIFQNPTAGIPGSILEPLLLDKNKKYKKIFDKFFPLSIYGGQDTKVIELFINKKFSSMLEYGNAATTGMNQIYLMVNTSDNIGLQNNGERPLMTLRSRVRYLDG